MEETSMSKLSQKLQQKTEADQERIEELTSKELKKLAENLRDGVQSELSTTKADIKRELRSILDMIERTEPSEEDPDKKVKAGIKPQMISRLNQIEEASRKQKEAALTHLKWSWLKYGIPALIVLIVICVSAWGLNQYLFSSLQSKLEAISKAERTLRQLPVGVSFQNDQEANYMFFEKDPIMDSYTSTSGHFVVKLEK